LSDTENETYHEALARIRKERKERIKNARKKYMRKYRVANNYTPKE